MSIRIRAATPEDAPEVVRVIRAVYDEYGFTWDPGSYHADLYDLQGHYFDPGHRFWVAQGAGGTVAGTVALEMFPLLPGEAGTIVEIEGMKRLAGCDCSLERLYVHPCARRQGAGTALFEAALAEARRQGRRALEIWSDKRFHAAHALYRKYGALSVGERICHDPDQSAEWGLVIRL